MTANKENKLLLLMSAITIVITACAIIYASGSELEDDYAVEFHPPETITETTSTQPTEIDFTEKFELEITPFDLFYNEDEVVMLAKLLYTECRGVPSTTRKACVAWVVCNRVDTGEYSSIYDAITSPGQFAWYSNVPVKEELYWIAQDVLTRWNNEKNGLTDVGRVIPADYLWFHGENGENYFRNGYSGKFDTWNYSLSSPYQD